MSVRWASQFTKKRDGRVNYWAQEKGASVKWWTLQTIHRLWWVFRACIRTSHHPREKSIKAKIIINIQKCNETIMNSFFNYSIYIYSHSHCLLFNLIDEFSSKVWISSTDMLGGLSLFTLSSTDNPILGDIDIKF